MNQTNFKTLGQFEILVRVSMSSRGMCALSLELLRLTSSLIAFGEKRKDTFESLDPYAAQNTRQGRIKDSGKGIYIYKGVGVRFIVFISFLLNNMKMK